MYSSFDTIIEFDYGDIQALSKKYFGDELTLQEMTNLQRICNPDDWARVDDGGYEGCLGQLISAVVAIIGLVRVDRRSRDIPLSVDPIVEDLMKLFTITEED